MVASAEELEAVVYRFPRAPMRRRRAGSVLAASIRTTGIWVLLLLVIAVVLLAGGSEAQAPAAPSSAPRAVVLEAGETLWGIADRYAPENVDPRAYVDAILELNGLAAPPPAGARIRLP